MKSFRILQRKYRVFCENFENYQNFTKEIQKDFLKIVQIFKILQRKYKQKFGKLVPCNESNVSAFILILRNPLKNHQIADIQGFLMVLVRFPDDQYEESYKRLKFVAILGF